MDDSLGELIVQISADVSQLVTGLSTANQAVQDFSNQSNNTLGKTLSQMGQSIGAFGTALRSVGRELSQLSSVFILAGGAGIAPFVLALHDAAGSIPAVGNAVAALTDVGQKFYESLAQSVLPVVKQFTQSLQGLLNWFLALPQAQRDFLAQTVLINSALALGTGLVIKFAAEIVRLTSDIALLTSRFLESEAAAVLLNPVFLAIAAAIALIINTTGSWQKAFDLILNTAQIVANSISNAFHQVLLVINSVLLGITDGLLNVSKSVASIAGPWQSAAKAVVNALQPIHDKLSKDITSDLQSIKLAWDSTSQIITTGLGSWATGANKALTTFQQMWAAFKKGATDAVDSSKTVETGIKDITTAGNQFSSALDSLASSNTKYAGAAKAVAYGMAIINTAQGITAALAGPPTGPIFPFNIALASIIAATGAIQLATIGSQGFATGTDSVPAMLSPGEMVIPTSFASAIRAGKLSLSGGQGSNTTNQNDNGTNITIQVIQPNIGSNMDVNKIANDIAQQTNRQLQYVRRRTR